MSTTTTLATYQMYIDGQRVDAASGECFETENPYTGKPWALIPRGTAEDVDRAVRAAHKAFTSGDWPKLTASRRGALLRTLGDLVGQRWKQLAETEVRDNGKLYAEMAGQTAVHRAVVPLLRRPGRQDRGIGHPARQAGQLQLHAPRAARRGRGDRSLEFAAAARRVEAGARAGGGQHRGHQAVGVHLGIDARVHAADRRRRLSAGRRQRGHRLRLGSRHAAGRASAGREDRVHRLGCDRPADLRGGGARDEARHAWSWAANRRTSCSTMPISTTPSKARSPASWPRPGRPASPARGCWCRRASTSRSSRSSSRSRGPRRWATR